MTDIPHDPRPDWSVGNRTQLRAITSGSLVAAYLAVVLGDAVRVTESGMGCVSWPLCNGHLGLAGGYHAILEQSHRYLAAVVTILIVATVIVAWRHARQDRLILRSASAALGFIGLQVVLGAVTVFAHNAGWTVALHLAGSWLILGAVAITSLGAWLTPAAVARPGSGTVRLVRQAAPAGRLGVVAAVSLFAVAVSGMLVLHGGASNACPGWPICARATASGGFVALQYVHRSLVLLATIIIVVAVARAWHSASAGPGDRILAIAALVLLAGTAALGAIVAVRGAPEAGQAAHLAVASALWIILVAMATVGLARRIEAQDSPQAMTATGGVSVS